MKDCALTAVPLAFVMVTGPLVAIAGTIVRIESALAERTIAGCPLKATWLSEAVALNPYPRISTTVPAAPVEGERK
ncbi:MAG TPA: hypothetical protein VGL91_12655 [Acidobacteriota bacterium]|jgi:hypothetical protein